MDNMKRRIKLDLRKLKNKGYKVELINDKYEEVFVEFHGPPNTLYHGHVWKTKVKLLDYPFKPPKIFFVDKIFHPNIAEAVVSKGEGRGNPGALGGFLTRVNDGGLVDFPPDYWIASYDLVYVYEMAIPQLLAEPNIPRRLAEPNIPNQLVDGNECLVHRHALYLAAPSNPNKPLNWKAAYLFSGDRATYDQTVKSYCTQYAKKENAGAAAEGSASSVAKIASEAESSGRPNFHSSPINHSTCLSEFMRYLLFD